jgi:hypothetical protein
MERSLGAFTLAAALAVPLAALPMTSGMQEGSRYTANAVSLGGPRTPSGTAQVDIVIDRWSSEAEQQRLMQAVKKADADQDQLLQTLQDLKPVGRISTPGNIGYDLRYANRVPGEDGGSRVFIATDRPIGGWEAANQPRSIHYPFTFIELRLNEKGTGEGKLALATRVLPSSDGKMIQLENYSLQPVMLNNVKRQEP